MVSTILAFLLASAIPPAQTPKNEFVFNNRGEPETIDPAKATGVPDNTIVVQLFEGLLTKKADWVTIIPGQAESYTRSKDGLTYTFKLRKNLKWSDGSPLTAKDFEYSWLRAINPATLAQYSFWMTDNIVGAADYNKNPTPENAAKVGFKATDDLTLTVKLNKPLSYFPHLTAESLFYPVKKEVVEKFGDAWTRAENIVGNGAFKMTDWKVQDRIVLVRNPNYWDAANVSLEKVTAFPIEDRQTALNLFKQGRLDWSGQNGVPNSLVPSLKSDPSFRTHSAFTTYFYRFNTTKAPLDDKRVRQALVLAIDRKSIVEQVTRGGELASGFVVPVNTGTYKSPAGLPTSDYRKDVERARALLTEAGYYGPNAKKMRPLVLIYNTDENHKKLALAVQRMWKQELGIDVQPQNQEWKVYLKNQQALNFDISRSAWQGDYPDPASHLENFLSTSGNNHTGFKNAKYDELFEMANRTGDEKTRFGLLNQAETLLLDEAPISPLYVYTNFGLLRPEIVGFYPNLVDRPYLRFVSKK